jgi:hypothetical protein
MIKFRFDPLDGLGTRLERAAERGRIALAAVDAVNAVTKRADESLRRGEIKDINLSPAYVKSKTDVALATLGSGKARAEIVTSGDLTTLGNFGVGFSSMPPGFGAKRRAGPRVGLRNAGTNVIIKKSSPVFEPQWFVLPLRRGSASGGNGFGVFVRDDRLAPSKKALREGKAGKRHIYGPSPYQLFKQQILLQQDDIQADLARTALARLGDALEEAL